MTRERLKQCRHMTREANEIIENIEVLESQCEYAGVVITDMPRGGVHPDLWSKLIELKNKFHSKYNELLAEIIDVEEFIEDIPDSATRRIFRLQYLKGLSWNKTANKVGYSRTQSIKLHNEYLDKVLKDSTK